MVMEGFTLINFTSISEEAPLFALGFAARRWGLEGFPANLVATTGSLTVIHDGLLNGTGMPYSCVADLPKTYANKPPWRVMELDGQTGLGSEFFRVTRRNLTAGSDICDGPQYCVDGGCIVVLENAFQSTNAVAIVHGVTVLLVAVLTLAMYYILARGYQPKRRNGKTIIPLGIQPSDLKDRYEPKPIWHLNKTAISTPAIPVSVPIPLPASLFTSDATRRAHQPGPRGQNWAPPQIVDVEHEVIDYEHPQDFTRSIVRCQNLLREVARIDQAISGMQFAYDEERGTRDELRDRGNATFNEVRRIVVALNRIPNVNDEDREIVRAIAAAIDGHPSERY